MTGARQDLVDFTDSVIDEDTRTIVICDEEVERVHRKLEASAVVGEGRSLVEKLLRLLGAKPSKGV